MGLSMPACGPPDHRSYIGSPSPALHSFGECRIRSVPANSKNKEDIHPDEEATYRNGGPCHCGAGRSRDTGLRNRRCGTRGVGADQNETGTTQTKKTVREQLEQTVAEATAKKDIQDKTSGGAYTADTYGILSDRLTDAQNLLDDPDTSDDRLQSALDALDKAVKNLKVASWTVNGVA